MAIKEQIVFPEIVPEAVKTIFGFQVNVTYERENERRRTRIVQIVGISDKK